MAGIGPGDLNIMAAELLEAAEDALDTVPVFSPGLEGAPARSFVSPGQPALDCCPQLTVHVTAIDEAPTAPLGLGAGTRARFDARLNMVAFQIILVRCSATGDLPKADDLDAVAMQVDADGWALWNHLWNMVRAGLLLTLCEAVYFDGIRPLVPQGGCVGWVMTIRVELQGYEEVLLS